MESFVTRIEVLESRLLFLEKRDKEKNGEILDLKEQNITLCQQFSDLKRQRKVGGLDEEEGSGRSEMECDLGGRMDKLESEFTKAAAELNKELGRVKSIQKVFNRMIVKGHQNDVEGRLTDLQTKVDELSTEMDSFVQLDMENKLSEMDTKLTKTKTEVSKVQRLGLDKKMASFQTNLEELNKDMADFKKDSAETKISELEVKLTKMKTQVSKLQRQGLEKKIISLVRSRLSDFTDMQVSVIVQSTGEKLSLDVEPLHTVSQLKSLLQRKVGVSPRYQMLELDGQQLTNDDLTLEELGIDETSGINFTYRGMQVFVLVQTSGERVTIDVEPSYTVAQVKLLINDKVHVSPRHQVLEFDYKEFLDEGRTLEDCGIQDGDLLSLTVKQSEWEICIKVGEGKDTRLDVDIWTSVMDVIVKAHDKMRIPMHRHRAIALGGVELDETKLLVEAGVKHGSCLELLLKEPQSTPKEGEIRLLFDKQILDVSPSTTVLHVKQLLHPRSATPDSSQNLKFNGQHLEDGKKII